MKIGIIGAGAVGGALTRAFARRGHQVVAASSDPHGEKMRVLIEKAGENASAGFAQQAVDHGDVLILATPWGATESILKELSGFGGKILIDATNPIKTDFSGLEPDDAGSGGERVARWAAGARVVKTLNQIGYELMDAPRVAAGRPLMFLAGDDDAAKKTAAQLVDELGFEADDCGGLAMARYLEALAWIWINRAIKQDKGRAFALLLSEAQPGA